MLIFLKLVELNKDHPALSVAVMTRRNCETFNKIFPKGTPTPLSYINKPDDVQPYATGYLNAVHSLAIAEPWKGKIICELGRLRMRKVISACAMGVIRERWIPLSNDCLHAPLDLIFGVIVHSFQEHWPDCLELKFYPSVPSQDLQKLLRGSSVPSSTIKPVQLPKSSERQKNQNDFEDLFNHLYCNRVGFKAFI